MTQETEEEKESLRPSAWLVLRKAALPLFANRSSSPTSRSTRRGRIDKSNLQLLPGKDGKRHWQRTDQGAAAAPGRAGPAPAPPKPKADLHERVAKMHRLLQAMHEGTGAHHVKDHNDHHVQMAINQGHATLHKRDDGLKRPADWGQHDWTHHVQLSDAGRRYMDRRRRQRQKKHAAAQTGLFKGAVLFLLMKSQLALFGSQAVEVKQHRRRTKTGKVASVRQHTAHRKKAQETLTLKPKSAEPKAPPKPQERRPTRAVFTHSLAQGPLHGTDLANRVSSIIWTRLGLDDWEELPEGIELAELPAAHADLFPATAADGWFPPVPESIAAHNAHALAEAIGPRGVVARKAITRAALGIIPSLEIARLSRYLHPERDKDPLVLPEGHEVPDLRGSWIALAEEYRQLLKTATHNANSETTRGKALALYEEKIRPKADALRQQLDDLDKLAGKDSRIVTSWHSDAFSLDAGYELRVGPSGQKRWMKIGAGDTDPDERITMTGRVHGQTDSSQRKVQRTIGGKGGVGTKGDLAEEFGNDEARIRGTGRGKADLLGQAPDILQLQRDYYAKREEDGSAWADLGVEDVVFESDYRGKSWPVGFVRDQIGRDFDDLSPRRSLFLMKYQRRLEKVWFGLPLADRERLYAEAFNPHLEGAAIWPKSRTKNNADLPIPAGMEKMAAKGWESHDFQAKGVNWFTGLKTRGGSPRGNFLMEMGLGKTLAALSAFHKMREAGKVDRMIVVAPMSTHGSWNDHINDLSDAGVVFAAGSKKKRDRLISEWAAGRGPQCLVITPESLATTGTVERMTKALGKTGRKRTLAVSDEVHKFKNPRANRTLQARKLFDMAGPNLGMTGTPQPNNAADLFWCQRFINHTAFDDPDNPTKKPQDREHHDAYAFQHFLRKFALSYEDERTGETIVAGYRRHAQGDLRKEVARNSFVRTLLDDDVRVELPPMNTVSPSIPMSKSQTAMAKWCVFYTAWEETCRGLERRAESNSPHAHLWAAEARAQRAALETHVEHNTDKMGELGYVARVGATMALVGAMKQIAISPEAALANRKRPELWRQVAPKAEHTTPKMKFTIDKTMEYLDTNPGRGAVIMAEYRAAHDIAIRELVERGIPREQIAIMRGGTSGPARRQIESDFNAGKYKILIAGTAAVETGANLQHNSSFLAHLTTPYNPTMLTQSTARVWRQGQKSITTVLRPVGSPVERAIEAIVGRKLCETAVSMGGMGAGEREVARSIVASRGHKPDDFGAFLDDAYKDPAEKALAAAIESGNSRALAQALGIETPPEEKVMEKGNKKPRLANVRGRGPTKVRPLEPPKRGRGAGAQEPEERTKAVPPTDRVKYRDPKTGDVRVAHVLGGGEKGVTAVDDETGERVKLHHGHYTAHDPDEEVWEADDDADADDDETITEDPDA